MAVGFPDVTGRIGDLAHAVYNSATPRTAEPQGAAQRQSPGEYLSAQASALDPRHPANWLNLAGIVIPGGRRGGPTPLQQMFLDQIHTGVSGRTFAGRTTHHLMPHNRPGDSTLSRIDVSQNPDLRALAEHLGFSYGNPLQELAVQSGRTPNQSFNRLGLTQDSGQSMFSHDAALKSSVDRTGSHPALIQQILARNAINRRN